MVLSIPYTRFEEYMVLSQQVFSEHAPGANALPGTAVDLLVRPRTDSPADAAGLFVIEQLDQPEPLTPAWTYCG